MKNYTKPLLPVAIALTGASATPAFATDSIADALSGGKAYGDFRLRFESVEQDNALEDAKAMTLRTRLGYKTAVFNGFSGVVEFEDNRIVAGVDDYNAAGLNSNGAYSVIADPEHTELDQGFLQYTSGGFSAKLGRQVLTLDNHRFVGHVGWRQDRQTFDALKFSGSPVKGLKATYAFIDKRNRIFAEERDVDSKDHLLNLSYQTSVGKLTAYSYLLEVDNDTDNALDTYGLRFSGAKKSGDTTFLYTAEFATQTSESGGNEFDADYMMLEGGVVFSGITAKIGYEVLGSDDGAYGFSTPLATLHKFNGWADLFLGTPAEGIEDFYVMAATKVGPGKLVAFFHDFSANEATATKDELGSELDVAYSLKFGKKYNAGLKYAAYSADDHAVDTDKLWVWFGASF